MDPCKYQIICTDLINFFEKKNSGSGSCKIVSDTSAFITIWNTKNEDFKKKFESLINCQSRNNIKLPSDLTANNTLWIEMLKSGGHRGFGKFFLDIFKRHALAYDYKYVFLYPSKMLGRRADQEGLIKYYESIGFHKLNSCDYWGFNPETFTEELSTINKGDGYAPYHLLIAYIEELKTEDDVFDIIPIQYEKKYLKYKNKYLELRKNTIN